MHARCVYNIMPCTVPVLSGPWSPSTAGGVARNTNEAIVLCEGVQRACRRDEVACRRGYRLHVVIQPQRQAMTSFSSRRSAWANQKRRLPTWWTSSPS
jgi:hypothetical protein